MNPTQDVSFSRDPEMILDLAHEIRNKYYQQTGRSAEVRALVLTTLNGRKPELLIDPNIDLAEEPRGFFQRAWIMPQQEQLRVTAWSVPIAEWRRYVNIPPLRFLNGTRRSSTAEADNIAPEDVEIPPVISKFDGTRIVNVHP